MDRLCGGKNVKLLAMVLVAIIALGFTNGQADGIVVPLTVNDIPIQIEPLPIPEYNLRYENGRAFLESDWFVQLEGSRVCIVTYDADRDIEYVFECSYDKALDMFVSDIMVEEAPVTSMEWFTPVRDGLHFFATMCFDDTGQCDAGIMATVDSFELDLWYEYLWGSDGILDGWIDHAGLTVHFDQFGNAIEYGYRNTDEREYMYTWYTVDGVLLDVWFWENEIEYTYTYDPVRETEVWRNENDEDILPPYGYTRAKLYELFPPLVIVKPTIPGDSNGDGELTLADAVVIIKSLAGEIGDISDVADVNADDMVDEKDLLLIMQHFAGWGNKLK